MRVAFVPRFVHFSVLGAGLLAAACGGSEAPPEAPPPPPPPMAAPPPVETAPPPAAAAPAAPAAPEAPAAAAPPPEHHAKNPMSAMLIMALGDVELKPEQKPTVDGITADLEKAGDGTKDARAQFRSDLADGVVAGKIDTAKSSADVKAIGKAAAEEVPQIQDAVNRLYKALDPEQRKKLVEVMRAKDEEHEKAMGEHMGPPPGGAPPAAGGPPGEHEHMGEGHEHMDKMAEMLGLTPDQRAKLEKALGPQMKAAMAGMKAKHEEMKKHMKAIGDAFSSDKFDAKKAGVAEKMAAMTEQMALQKVKFVTTVLGVLTAEQRDKFGAHVRGGEEEEE